MFGAGRRAVSQIGDILWPLGAVGIAILGWHLYVKLADVPIVTLPPPGDTFVAVFSNAGSLLSHSLVTITEIAAGFGAGVAVGIPLALFLDRFRRIERMVYPFLVATQVIPVIAIAPIIVLWLGYELLSKVATVMAFCVFIIVIESLVGLRSLEVEKTYLANSMGASSLNFFVKIKIPHALPQIFEGLKLAGTLAVIGAVVAEFIASERGLGHYILTANARLDTASLFSAIVYISVIGLTTFYTIAYLERLAIPWHVSHRLRDNHS